MTDCFLVTKQYEPLCDPVLYLRRGPAESKAELGFSDDVLLMPTLNPGLQWLQTKHRLLTSELPLLFRIC